MVESPHLCYMQVIYIQFLHQHIVFYNHNFQIIDESTKSPPFYIFFDMETTQEVSIGKSDYGEIYQHIVNLVCAEKVCY